MSTPLSSLRAPKWRCLFLLLVIVVVDAGPYISRLSIKVNLQFFLIYHITVRDVELVSELFDLGELIFKVI